MSEQPEVETFVRKEPDGTEQVRHFAPWPTGPGGQPQMQMRVVLVQVPEGDGGDSELRHLSYDDPPGMGVTPDQYREMLASAVAHSEDEGEFTEMLISAIGRDLVMAHGVSADVAIRAVMEFARKVYAEFRA
jgi:hypothetical protein